MGDLALTINLGDSYEVDAFLLTLAVVGDEQHLSYLPAATGNVFEQVGYVLGVDCVSRFIEDEEIWKVAYHEQCEALS